MRGNPNGYQGVQTNGIVVVKKRKLGGGGCCGSNQKKDKENENSNQNKNLQGWNNNSEVYDNYQIEQAPAIIAQKRTQQYQQQPQYQQPGQQQALGRQFEQVQKLYYVPEYPVNLTPSNIQTIVYKPEEESKVSQQNQNNSQFGKQLNYQQQQNYQFQQPQGYPQPWQVQQQQDVNIQKYNSVYIPPSLTQAQEQKAKVELDKLSQQQQGWHNKR